MTLLDAPSNGHSSSFAVMDDLRLIDSEAGLHKMYDLRKSVGGEVDALLMAHDLLTKEMRARGLFYEPLEKRAFSQEQRDKDAASGVAENDGSYPIKTATDLANVVADCNRTGQKPSDMAHIRTRAKALGLPDPFSKGLETIDQLTMLAASVVDLPSAEMFTKAVGDASIEDRKKWAATGVSLADGSLPIPDEAHLHTMIRLQPQHADPQAAMNHIIERAKAIGAEHALPEAWRNSAAEPESGEPAVGAGAHSQYPDAPKKGIVAKLRKALGLTEAESNVILKVLDAELEEDGEYLILKSAPESRYTMGPMYMPDQLDAHGEWTTAADLEKSMFKYVEQTGATRDVFLQHKPDIPAGKWLAVMPWPYEVSATVRKSIDGVTKAESTTFPAGTVFMGVQWEPWAWPLVKSGEITGLSMGGHARRVEGSPS